MILIPKNAFFESKRFFYDICFSHLLPTMIPYFHAKIQKKLMIQFFTKSKKPFFGPNLPKKNFFSKIEIRHIRGFIVVHLCTKNPKILKRFSRDWLFNPKILKSQSREKLLTNERTNGRTQVNL